MSSPSGNKRELAAFLAAANRIAGSSDESGLLFAKRWPDWFEKVLLRLAGVLLPELPLSDLRENPVKFFANLGALQLDMTTRFEAADLAEFSATPALKKLCKQLHGANKADHAAIKETQSRAMDLPKNGKLTFIAAQGTTVKNQTAAKVIRRIQTSPTVKICFFLILNRGVIENRKVATVGELFGRFYEWLGKNKDKVKSFYKKNASAEVSMKAQFQKICSECGVRLSTRGRPRVNLD